jgi:5'-methylthioadenosine phosphorylase
MIGIIGGSGVYDLPWLENPQENVCRNKYGEALIKSGWLDGFEVAFLTRHGKGHKVSPSMICYRANIMALADFGVTDIVATYAVGGISPKMVPGDFAICDQFIDFTKTRIGTYYDQPGKVVHTDVSKPYSPKLQEYIEEALVKEHSVFHPDAVYVCTEGPRYETPAEIKAFSVMGATIVGMTGCPEVALANELGMAFGGIAVITNLAAGVAKHPLGHREVMDMFHTRTAQLAEILKTVAKLVSEDPSLVSRPESMSA